MALISIVLIVVGFLIQVYAGVKLSLSSSMQTESGHVNQSKVAVYALILGVSSIMIIAGVLGYYAFRGNLPYYNNFF